MICLFISENEYLNHSLKNKTKIGEIQNGCTNYLASANS